MLKIKIPFLMILLVPLFAFAEHMISFPSHLKVFPGDTILVPIDFTFDATDPIDKIDAYGFKVDIPHQLAAYIETSNEGTLTNDWIISQGTAISDSTINIGGFNLTPLEESGTLLYVKLFIKPDVVGTDTLKIFDLVDDLAGATVQNGVMTTPYPPVMQSIPIQHILEGESFAPITLDDYVSDPDTPLEQLIWSVAFNQELQVDIVNHVATITTPDSNWNGTEKIGFSVMDTDSLSDGVLVTFHVEAVNDPPQLAGISDQTIKQGEEFAVVNLYEIVTDIDDPLQNLTWRFSGTTNLDVTQKDNLAIISAKESAWFGSETITFTVQDTAGAEAGTSATFTILEAAPPITGLIGHWSFDAENGMTAFDSSGAGNHGDVIGAWWVEGKCAGALSFNGASSLVNVPHSPTLEVSDQLTLCAWIFLENAQGSQNVLQKEFISLGEIRDGGLANVLNIDNQWMIYPYTLSAADFIGAWHHIAMTYDGAKVTNYLDGAVNAVFEQRGVVNATTADLGIGTNNPWQNAWFHGRLDDVRMYNIALREEKIDSIRITTRVAAELSNLPTAFELEQNYPNPFNPTTKIGYAVPVETHVTMRVYNTLGQVVKTLVDAQMAAGRYAVVWDGTSDSGSFVSPGVYLVRLQNAEHDVQLIKMVLAK